MKVFTYNKVKAKKYGNTYAPLKNSIVIIIVGVLLLTVSSIISFKYDLLMLTVITIVVLIIGIILAVINFTSKINLDLSALVIDNDSLMVIKVNPLANKKDLNNLKNKYMKKTKKSINKLMQDDKFIAYLIENVNDINEFEITKVLNIYSKKISDKKIAITCDLYDLKNKIIKYNTKLTILNAYSRQTEIYEYIKNYKNEDKYTIDINKMNKKRYNDLFAKNIENLEFWLMCSLVFTFLIIILKLTVPFICTIPFYAEIMTFALTLSCYDPANDTNYIGSNKTHNYIKIAIASFIVSLLVCFVWR